MTIHFPKLRLPSFAELLALFHRPVAVSAILAGLQRQARDLDAAIHFHADLSDLHDEAAAASARLAAEARDQMARAARVAGKLADLIA